MSETATQVEVKERPIVFRAPMVRAVLGGWKTQARCAMVPQPQEEREAILNRFPNQKGSPYGETGDRLWGREALRWTDWLVYDVDQAKVDPDRIPSNARIGRDYLFASHMPRWASRITLEIINIRVERLQKISCADVMAEGSPVPLREHSNLELGIQCVSAKEWFQQEWDRLNKKYGYTWAADPFVWVIEFKRV